VLRELPGMGVVSSTRALYIATNTRTRASLVEKFKKIDPSTSAGDQTPKNLRALWGKRF
jgi:hypothetical protein